MIARRLFLLSSPEWNSHSQADAKEIKSGRRELYVCRIMCRVGMLRLLFVCHTQDDNLPRRLVYYCYFLSVPWALRASVKAEWKINFRFATALKLWQLRLGSFRSASRQQNLWKLCFYKWLKLHAAFGAGWRARGKKFPFFYCNFSISSRMRWACTITMDPSALSFSFYTMHLRCKRSTKKSDSPESVFNCENEARETRNALSFRFVVFFFGAIRSSSAPSKRHDLLPRIHQNLSINFASFFSHSPSICSAHLTNSAFSWEFKQFSHLYFCRLPARRRVSSVFMNNGPLGRGRGKSEKSHRDE